MSNTKVITGRVRFSYLNVFTPVAQNEGEEKKFKTTILIPKKDKKQIARIEEAIEAAIQQGKDKKFEGKVPARKLLKLPLRDGDEEYPDKEEYEGMMFINASNTDRPEVVDANTDPIIDKSEFQSGDWGRASINFYPFNHKGKKGVAASLGNVQKLEEGERFSAGRSSAADDFGSSNDEDDLF